MLILPAVVRNLSYHYNFLQTHKAAKTFNYDRGGGGGGQGQGQEDKNDRTDAVGGIR